MARPDVPSRTPWGVRRVTAAGAPGLEDEVFPPFAIEARWVALRGPGGEQVRIHLSGDAIHVASRLEVATPERLVRLAYALTMDPDWHTRSLDVRDLDTREHLRIEADGEGHWTDAAGDPLDRLQGCLDVDVRGAPFTNALPLNRLTLEVGRATEVPVVYVDWDDQGLTVEAAVHRYTRLHEDERGGRVRFEHPDTRYATVLEVDPAGLVMAYPGLARRVA